MRRLVPRAKAPLGLAGFLAIPLFFSAVMSVSLAIDKPHRYEWMRVGKLVHGARGAAQQGDDAPAGAGEEALIPAARVHASSTPGQRTNNLSLSPLSQ